jgi:hypothetical protein
MVFVLQPSEKAGKYSADIIDGYFASFAFF